MSDPTPEQDLRDLRHLLAQIRHKEAELTDLRGDLYAVLGRLALAIQTTPLPAPKESVSA
ncbi:hypothetical protein [Deinococcus peraridilitoris]|uniref:Uncharacterized protein n=1 Tax=Deinococcus peraridilitoris (strain DSM 19664 / LMG 22246 / CIP 109416 / KR-200) TaxID=937777 RepID=K9ZZI6_DEIPD|nr:hypothetical protein [Deinococcus peraridilitoris]AFZ67016.1 hypothetical protein Deipe_1475 [Deinococcus peraridilitoris DSM 19664]